MILYSHVLKRSILAFLGFFAFLPTLHATETASNPLVTLLQESAGIARTIPYRGNLSYFRLVGEEKWTGTIEIYRASEQEKKITVLAPDFLKGVVIQQNKDGIWITQMEEERINRIQEGSQNFLWYRLFRGEESLNFDDPDLLLENYDVTNQGEIQIAGRTARWIHVTPKFENRPSLRMAIDLETRMLLQYERYNYKGEIYESFVFEEIRLGESIPAESMSTDGLVSAFHSPPPPGPTEERTPDFAPMEIRKLPQGFRYKEQNVWRGREGLVIHTLFSDGVARLSVYQRRMTDEEIRKQQEEEKNQPSDKPLVKEVKRRGRSVYAREYNGIRVVGVGDIDPDEIIQTLLRSCSGPGVVPAPKEPAAGGEILEATTAGASLPSPSGVISPATGNTVDSATP